MISERGNTSLSQTVHQAKMFSRGPLAIKKGIANTPAIYMQNMISNKETLNPALP